MTIEAGFDPGRMARIGPFLQSRYVDTGLLAGAQVAVLRRGQVAHFSNHGLADEARGEPVRDDTIFRIYSMTKPITSIAFMMLVEEGKVALDDPVHRFIPAWRGLSAYESGEFGAFKTRPTAAPMRMVDLLRHTSGLTYDFQYSNAVDAAYRSQKLAWAHGEHDLEGFVEALAGLPLVASPGDVWNYSVSTDVLGYLIEKIAGMAFPTFLKTRIFDPLGMKDTGFHVPEGQGHRLAACYTLPPGGSRQLLDDPTTSRYLTQPKFPSGGGGLVSTSADYLQFVRMLLGRGELNGHRFISGKTLDMMTVNHIPGGRDLTEASISLFSEGAYAGVGFGLGFAVTMDPAKALMYGSAGDFWWGGMASTAFWVDPAEDLACVFMTQLTPSNSYPIRRQLRTLVYSALT